MPNGLKKGTYDLGGQPVNVDETKATLSDGTLAGSILKMNDAIKNTMEYTDCSMTDIIKNDGGKTLPNNFGFLTEKEASRSAKTQIL
ncbi:hypothetical protein RCO48_19240 [Peribacillus frigoritolerans]|nr:hypothetical protein [Peribacillus frigoritolerans]